MFYKLPVKALNRQFIFLCHGKNIIIVTRNTGW